MQLALFQQTDKAHLSAALNGVLPGHGTGIQAEAANDGEFHAESSKVRMALSVVGNVLGGSVLLASMYFFPYIAAALLG